VNDFDVVVVGGRVAGASTAMLLARAGVRVALVDRGTYGSDTLSTHGLMRAGVLQLHRWGLLDDVVAEGTPAIRRTKFHYAHGETTVVDIRPSPGVPALYAPRRYLLDRLLVDAAARAGTVVLHEHTVTSLLRERDRVAGVRARRTPSRASSLCPSRSCPTGSPQRHRRDVSTAGRASPATSAEAGGRGGRW